MATLLRSQGALDPASRDFYQRVMRLLAERQLDFLVGGAYSFARYTGIERHTKDFDIFVRPTDAPRILAALAEAGYQAKLTFPHWLGKAYCGDSFIDVIFSSGNGIATVDDIWFERSVPEHVLEIPVRLCPAEETIWSKSFIMERERYDGADIAHLIRATAPKLDWQRLLTRFGPHWRVLYSHLVMFGFIYPGERSLIPPHIMAELTHRLTTELRQNHAPKQLCQGTLFSRAQYLVDVEDWGYRDARLQPMGGMSQGDIDRWTAAIDSEPATPAVRPTTSDAAPVTQPEE
jgi:hypothetical protein